ncbi:hypothetical protein [Desulfoluna sp.]|uniref:hypothetical protein n=1 Tax=Desulfoluna sp. TaxID=2045199 RepID=UPI00260C2B38|nr:hypothetical protein [Desulfoluna sp.]
MEFARTADDLEALVAAHPDRFPTEFIEEGTFAEDLMKNHAYKDLAKMVSMPADPGQMAQWSLTEDQWTEQVTLAWLAFKHEHSL